MKFVDSEVSQIINRKIKKSLADLETHKSFGGWVGIIDENTGFRYGESMKDLVCDGDIKISDPGTVDVGIVLLELYNYTNNSDLLNQCEAIAAVLISVQQQTGGWGYWGMTKGNVSTKRSRGTDRIKHLTSFDEGTTPLVITFLLDLYDVTSNQFYLDAARKGINCVVAAQNADGGWPQYYPLSDVSYANNSSFNDETSNRCYRILIQYDQQIGSEAKVNRSIANYEEFLIGRQANFGGWAQQYDSKGNPASARGIEPAAYSSAVSGACIRDLLSIYFNGPKSKSIDKLKVKTALEKAESWLKRSELKKNTWARFYDLSGNKPIFVDYDGKRYKTLEKADMNRSKFRGYSYNGHFGIPNLLIDLDRWKKFGDAKFMDYLYGEKGYTIAYKQKQLLRIDKEIEACCLQQEGFWYLYIALKELRLLREFAKFNII